MTSLSTTPRRSKRFQPIIDTDGPGPSTHETVEWLDEPLHCRTAQVIDLHEEDEIESLEDAQTSLYRAFTRNSQGRGPSRKRKSVTAANTDEDVFHVGDTVLVKSQAKLPSVAVIVSLWEVRAKDEDDDEIVLQKVKVHWFLRPSELPTVRARKESHAHVSALPFSTICARGLRCRHRTKYSSRSPVLQYSHRNLFLTIVTSAPNRQTMTTMVSQGLPSLLTLRILFSAT